MNVFLKVLFKDTVHNFEANFFFFFFYVQEEKKFKLNKKKKKKKLPLTLQMG